MYENLLTLNPPVLTKGRDSCLNFITAQASIFHDNKLLDDDTFNSLRDYLRLTHIAKDQTHRILCDFSAFNDSFFSLIELHTPLNSWTWNYLKFSLRSHFEYQIEAIHGLCQIILERLPLALNKQIHLAAQNQNILFSSIALEFVDQCTAIIERLRNLRTKTESWTYLPDRWDSAFLDQMHTSLAQRLDFTQRSRMLVVSADQVIFFKEWAMALRQFSSISELYNEEWGQSLTELPHALVKVMIDECRSELNSFDDIRFTDTADLELFDLKHHELLQRLQRINNSMHTALLGMARGFAGITKVPSDQSVMMTQDAQRCLGRFLLSKGVEPKRAVSALDSLQKYQVAHNTKASALIEPELLKISPVLSSSFAEKLRDLEAHDALSTQATTDKEHNFKLQVLLSTRLQSLICKSLSLMFLMLSLAGCGLKTLPKADIEDLRPEIPFRRSVSSADTIHGTKTATKGTDSKKITPVSASLSTPKPKEKTP